MTLFRSVIQFPSQTGIVFFQEKKQLFTSAPSSTSPAQELGTAIARATSSALPPSQGPQSISEHLCNPSRPCKVLNWDLHRDFRPMVTGGKEMGPLFRQAPGKGHSSSAVTLQSLHG